MMHVATEGELISMVVIPKVRGGGRGVKLGKFIEGNTEYDCMVVSVVARDGAGTCNNDKDDTPRLNNCQGHLLGIHDLDGGSVDRLLRMGTPMLLWRRGAQCCSCRR
jgi:hypothetical protein